VYLWRTPHGYWFRVDHHGTHPLGKNPQAQEQPDDAAHDQDGTVDLWVSPFELDLTDLIANAC
jgi:hypothetical protein